MSQLVLLVMVALSGVVYSAPQVYRHPYDAEYDAHPRYTFSYGVEEPITGDFKKQEESRDGDVVRGSYSLVEPDGTHRQVDYTADDATGFNAVVTKNGVPQGTQRAVGAAPVYRGGLLYNSAAYPQVTAYQHPVDYNNPYY